jgi:hypothetical protein
LVKVAAGLQRVATLWTGRLIGKRSKTGRFGDYGKFEGQVLR